MRFSMVWSPIQLSAISLIGSLITFTVSHAQREVGIPFEKRKAYVLGFTEPDHRIRLDLGDNEFTKAIFVEGRLTEDARCFDPNGKQTDCSTIVPGTQVEVSGEKVRAGFIINWIKLETDLEKWNVTLDGIYEKFDGEIAFVDGRRVVMNGSVIKGINQWERITFKSFDEMQLGSFVKIEGRRDSNGLVHVKKGETWPNLDDGDRAIRDALKQSIESPQQLSGGRMKIGNMQYSLVQDLELQAYVTEIGYRLIPQWVEELPEDDPNKVVFRFYVVHDPSFNAAAFPDGTVIVHTGLLRVLTNAAQLTAVLAHEIAHVTHEHGRKHLEESKDIKETKSKLAFGTDIFEKVTGQNVDMPDVEVGGFRISSDVVATLGAGALISAHRREREEQADRVGLFYMVEAGHDPREAATMWSLLAEQTKAAGGIQGEIIQAIYSIYSSHPETVNRARNLNLEIAANYSMLDLSDLTVGEEAYAEIRRIAAAQR